jgi:hypothetical protein
MTERSTVVALAGHKSNGEPVREEMLVELDGDGSMRLLATPALVLGVAADDLISLNSAGEVTVVSRGRNLAVQVYADHEEIGELISNFSTFGGRVDSRARGVTVFTVPVEVGFPCVESLLRRFVLEHPGAEWYYGNVYAADGITPLNWWV